MATDITLYVTNKQVFICLQYVFLPLDPTKLHTLGLSKY